MFRDRFDDESLADPLQLLTRYRQLCKALGAAQVTGAAVPHETQEQLARIEAELKTRLWLAGQNGDQASAVSRQPSTISHQSSVISLPPVTQDPELRTPVRTQNSELRTLHPRLPPSTVTVPASATRVPAATEPS